MRRMETGPCAGAPKRGATGWKVRGGREPGRGGRAAGAIATAALLLLLLPLAGCKIERATGDFDGAEIPPNLDRQVSALLQRSAAAWNAGDLDGFMASYARAPSTTFAAGGELLTGWDAIHSHYAPRFAPGMARDSLHFEGVRTRAMGQRHALVVARWVLVRDGEVTASGPFSLVLLRVEGSWRIIHDHSSGEARPAAGEELPEGRQAHRPSAARPAGGG